MATTITPRPGTYDRLPPGCAELLTPGEAAEALGLTPSGLRARAARGQVPFVRTPGGWRRYRAADVLALLDGGAR